MSYMLRQFNRDFELHVGHHTESVALLDARTERAWTYGQMEALTRRLAAFLLHRGALPGQPVVSLLPNGVEQLSFFLATIRQGIDFCPLTPQMSARETARFTKMMSPAVCLLPEHVEPSVRETLEEAGIPIATIVTDGRFQWLKEPFPEGPGHSLALGRASSRLYVATSGTTAEPKVLVIPADTLWSSAVAFAQQHSFLDSNSRFYNVLPMSYLGGLFNLGLIPLAVGGSVVICDSFSAASFLSFWNEVERWGVNLLWLTPTMVRGLLAMRQRMRDPEAPLSNRSIRAAFLGMAPIDLNTKQLFEQEFGFPLLENYGLSETTFIATETMEHRSQRVEGSVGKILTYVEVRFSQSEREIEVRSPFLCEGTLSPSGKVPLGLTEDRFFKTGDLGHLEGDGTLALRGRIRDIVKKGGYLVSLREMECVAMGFPGIAEAVAVGVPHDFYGEDAVLFVRLKADALSGGRPARSLLMDLRSWMASELPRFKWPSRVIVTEEFPRTLSGKVKKQILGQRLADNDSFIETVRV